MSIAHKAIPLVTLALLLGCGGSGHVDNAAHLRFFDALSDTGNVRLYVGGHLYEANGGSASIENGDAPAYEGVPSGSVSLVVNDYTNQNASGNSSSLATLTSQTLTQGLNYTAVAFVSGTSKKLVLFSDNSTLTSGNAYFRVIDAYSTTTPVYLQLRDKAANGQVYQSSTTSGLTVGSSTGFQSLTTSGTDALDYTLTVYSDSAFTNPIGSTTISLTAGKSVTAFLYNSTSGTSLRFKSATDRNGTSSTATTAAG